MKRFLFLGLLIVAAVFFIRTLGDDITGYAVFEEGVDKAKELIKEESITPVILTNNDLKAVLLSEDKEALTKAAHEIACAEQTCDSDIYWVMNAKSVPKLLSKDDFFYVWVCEDIPCPVKDTPKGSAPTFDGHVTQAIITPGDFIQYHFTDVPKAEGLLINEEDFNVFFPAKYEDSNLFSVGFLQVIPEEDAEGFVKKFEFSVSDGFIRVFKLE